MKVEIKLIRTDRDTRESLRDELERLGDTFFPLAIVSADYTQSSKRQVGQSYEDYMKAMNKPRSCSWSGSLEDFIKCMKIRESFGQLFNYKTDPEKYTQYMDEMRELLGLKLIPIREEIGTTS